MRNLKKFLALVLAMMMVMGLMVTANAADVKTDGVDGKYLRAVQITTKMGLFVGDENGDFNPTRELSRAEFATLLYRLDSGDLSGKAPAAYEGQYPFADLTADSDDSIRWAAPYVAYAYSNGLMIGTGGNSFSPKATIDGTHVALTLLRILGYGSDENLSGSNYKQWVQIYAANTEGSAKLTSDETVSVRELNKVLNRDAVAQLFWNALLCEKVVYDDRANVIKSLGYTLGTQQFNLETGTEDVDQDVWGVPASKVETVKVNGNAVYSSKPAAVATFASGTFNAEAAKPYVDAKAEMTVYYNGGKDVLTFDDDADHGLWLEGGAIPGYEVEIYANGKTLDAEGKEIDSYHVIVREAYLGQVTDIANDGKITLNVYEYKTTATYAGIADTDAIHASLKGYEKGAYVAVYVKNGGLESPKAADLLAVEALESVKDAKVTAMKKADKNCLSTFTINNGTTPCTISNEAMYTSDGKTFTSGIITNGKIALGKTYTLWTYKGHVLLADESKAEATTPAPTAVNSIYVVNTWDVKTDDTKNEYGEPVAGSTVYWFQGVLADGTVILSAKIGNTEEGKDGALKGSDIKAGTGYQYDYNAETEAYTLKDATNKTTEEGIAKVTVVEGLNANTLKLDEVYFADNVKFISVIKGEKRADLKAETRDGVQKLTSATTDWVVYSKVDGQIMITAYITEQAFSTEQAANDLIYIPSTISSAEEILVGDAAMYQVSVYVNGELKQITVPYDNGNGLANLTAGWHTYSIDTANGSYKVAKDAPQGTANGVTVKSLTLLRGNYLITINGTDLVDADATNAVIIDTTTNGIADLAGLRTAVNAKTVTVGVSFSDNTVSMIYITNVEDPA